MVTQWREAPEHDIPLGFAHDTRAQPADEQPTGQLHLRRQRPPARGDGGGAPEGGQVGAGANAAEAAASSGDGMVYTDNTFVSTGDGGSIEITESGDTFTRDAEGNITEINGISTAGDNAAATTENQASIHEAQQETASNGNGGNGSNTGGTPSTDALYPRISRLHGQRRACSRCAATSGSW